MATKYAKAPSNQTVNQDATSVAVCFKRLKTNKQETWKFLPIPLPPKKTTTTQSLTKVYAFPDTSHIPPSVVYMFGANYNCVVWWCATGKLQVGATTPYDVETELSGLTHCIETNLSMHQADEWIQGAEGLLGLQHVECTVVLHGHLMDMITRCQL